MWILTPLQPEGVTQYLLPGKEYVVGRKNCDIILQNDQSISRAHAHLSATNQTLTLKDTSKYGSFVDGQRVAENTAVNLTSGSNITFGVFNSKFNVQKLVVCSSCLDNDGKASLSLALQQLGGTLVNSWTQDCTHLVMSTVKVTIKTICALLCCRPIVKPDFFSDLHSAIQNHTSPPEAERFLPEIDEPSLNKEEVKLTVIQKRKELFTGKTFIFLNAKQMKRLNAAIGFGGGKCRLLEEGSLPLDVLESAQTCVVDAVTGSSQPVLSPSAVEWIKSVKNIVEQKNLRVITESEIGLAAIHASCEKHCNSSQPADGETVSKVKTRIPNASLSQSTAVDETVLPAPSLNITAYAANTEPSQGLDTRDVSGVMAVGETPEKKQKSKHSLTNVGAENKTESQYVVAESQRSSLDAVEQTEPKRTIEESKLTEEQTTAIPQQPFFAKPNGGAKTWSQKLSPQKLKSSAQGSPQKQSSLRSFFQPINKKRQLEDECSIEMSQPKRAATSTLSQPPKTDEESRSEKGRTDASQSSRSAADGLNKSRGHKRKEMEEEIKPDELEFLMSEDMDSFDEPPLRNQSQQKVTNLGPQMATGKTDSSSKRQRLQEEPLSRKSQQFDLEKPSTSGNTHGVKIKEQNVSFLIDTFQNSENTTDNKRLNMSQAKQIVKPATKEENKVSFSDKGIDFVEDLELLEAVASVPAKPSTVKLEVKESKLEDSLPKNLLLVEFRDLKMTEPPTRPLQLKQSNSFTKNFKCFRKVQTCGVAPVIRGADLLAHNRGRNSDLDEWLKDAAEEELQSRRDEKVGDDLFRYNPSKFSRRR